MRKIILFLLLTTSFSAVGQNYHQDFLKHLRNEDTTQQKTILEEWELAHPEDPELFTSYFNYYFQQSKKDVISITDKQTGGKAFTIQDSAKNTVGYIGSEVSYDLKIFQKGIAKISEGIALHPDRLDMRFGKIYAYGQIEDWENFTTEIITSIQYANKNQNAWLWANNKLLENPIKTLLSSIQDYQLQLYNTADDQLLINMQKIAKEVLKYHPKHVPSLSNLSITYLIQKDYDKALTALHKAENIQPKDAIVLSNIARGYELKENTAKAIMYYKKIIKFTDKKNKIHQFALQKIEKLEMNNKQ